METHAKILICLENADERRRIIDGLGKDGIRHISEAADGESAIGLIATGGFDLVLCDLWLSGLDGIGIIRNTANLGLKEKPSFILPSGIRPSFL